MGVPVQGIRKELLHVSPAEISRRQTDTVNDNEFGLHAGRPVILVRGRTLRPRSNQAGSGTNDVVQQLSFSHGNFLLRRRFDIVILIGA